MTPKEFEKEMKGIEQTRTDVGDFHADADKLMMLVLRELGYSKGITIFENADKWYE